MRPQYTDEWRLAFYCRTDPRAVVIRRSAILSTVARSDWEGVSKTLASGGVFWAYGHLRSSPGCYLVLHRLTYSFVLYDYILFDIYFLITTLHPNDRGCYGVYIVRFLTQRMVVLIRLWFLGMFLTSGYILCLQAVT